MITFQSDIDFLSNFMEIDLLKSPSGKAMIAVSPTLQARVMTSTSGDLKGKSYGWINRAFISAGDTVAHMNPYGGEERFWMGPEGGQYSIFFKPGDLFNLENWQTPSVIDIESFGSVEKEEHKATYQSNATLTNYSGFTFDVGIKRTLEILSEEEISSSLGVNLDELNVVGYKSENTIFNQGNKDWKKESGLLSIWLLGMFHPSDQTTIVIPFEEGPIGERGPIVNDEYFGKVPAERLKIENGIIYFKGDGKSRGKIGISPRRAKNVLGSYDELNKILTIVKFSLPQDQDQYVNSSWEIQEHPYKGDVINSYNDGPPEPGVDPMGPFYELETSSPALELKVGESGSHIQETFHFEGDLRKIDGISQRLLGVGVDQINSVF